MKSPIKPYHWLFLIMTLGAVGLFFLNPTEYAFFPKCPFKMLTGWSCPGCGLQRAVHSILHGEVVQAIQYNLFLVLSIPYAAGLVLTEWCIPKNRGIRLRAILTHRLAIYTYIALFILWGFIRNLLDI